MSAANPDIAPPLRRGSLRSSQPTKLLDLTVSVFQIQRIILISPSFLCGEMAFGSRIYATTRFRMPSLFEPEEAAAAILAHLDDDSFEIAFPTGFALVMKLLRLLPNRVYFPIARRLQK